MTLEDHLGDIIRKGRGMSGVSMNAAASAAGLSTDELKELERSGLSTRRLKFKPLGELIGLDPQRLENIANGWLPAVTDLNRWQQLQLITTADDDMSVNCFLAWDPESHQAALFDTGFTAEPVLECVTAKGLKLEHIFITHGHSDHVEGLPVLRRRFPEARLHWDAPGGSGGQRNVAGECTQLGGLQISHRPTPGHAADGVTYLIGNWPGGAPQVAIVGDALFSGSMGRAPGAWDLARRAVREEILSLPAATLICPGHGPLTTVGEEAAHNPFFWDSAGLSTSPG